MIWNKDKPKESGRYSIIYRFKNSNSESLYLISNVEYSAEHEAWNASDDDISNAFEGIEVVAYMNGSAEEELIKEVMNNDRS